MGRDKEISENKRTFSAACIVAGNGIGSGVMAIPYFVVRAGIVGGVLAFLLAYLVSVLMHLMIAELMLHEDNVSDILGVFNTYLFKGRAGGALRLLFFVILVVVLEANLAAYISGAADIITPLIAVKGAVIRIVFYVVAALVVLLGLKAVAAGEGVTVILMTAILVTAVVFSAANINADAGMVISGSLKGFAALFSMIMFSFSAIFAVPQSVEYLKREVKPVRRSIQLGLLINLVLSVTVAVCTIITSKEVTEIAIVGWADAVGGTVRILGSLFIVFAMLTSFWSIGLASSDIVSVQTGLKGRIAFAIATVPALILTFVSGSGFMGYLKIVGGAVALIISLMVIPSFVICMKNNDKPALMNRFEKSKYAVAFVLVMYLVMAVGSVF
ncbi:MAG: hypothetical protein K6E63_09450 [Lachnospiraceae bacterium]|nr:hypothetical protein [Lachnospiraceae bacterium]